MRKDLGMETGGRTTLDIRKIPRLWAWSTGMVPKGSGGAADKRTETAWALHPQILGPRPFPDLKKWIASCSNAGTEPWLTEKWDAVPSWLSWKSWGFFQDGRVGRRSILAGVGSFSRAEGEWIRLGGRRSKTVSACEAGEASCGRETGIAVEWGRGGEGSMVDPGAS